MRNLCNAVNNRLNLNHPETPGFAYLRNPPVAPVAPAAYDCLNLLATCLQNLGTESAQNSFCQHLLAARPELGYDHRPSEGPVNQYVGKPPTWWLVRGRIFDALRGSAGDSFNAEMRRQVSWLGDIPPAAYYRTRGVTPEVVKFVEAFLRHHGSPEGKARWEEWRARWEKDPGGNTIPPIW